MSKQSHSIYHNQAKKPGGSQLSGIQFSDGHFHLFFLAATFEDNHPVDRQPLVGYKDVMAAIMNN